jgi:8-oxo-dGTP diphosphatase
VAETEIPVRTLEEIEAQVAAEKNSPEARHYDPSKFYHPAVTVDLVIFTLSDRDLQVLLIHREQWPFRGRWALPGGFVRQEESLSQAAHRQLLEETGVSDVFLEQLHTFGHPHRDPRMRVVTVAYYALVPADKLPRSVAGGRVRWSSVYHLPELAFDHDRILDLALRRLRQKILTTNVAFQFMPQKFTLTQLQRTYEIVLGRTLDKRNFRKKVLSGDVVIETEEKHLQGRHRPARLYQFDLEARDF